MNYGKTRFSNHCDCRCHVHDAESFLHRSGEDGQNGNGWHMEDRGKQVDFSRQCRKQAKRLDCLQRGLVLSRSGGWHTEDRLVNTEREVLFLKYGIGAVHGKTS